MKKVYLFLSVFLIGATTIQAQTTEGKDFWLTFGQIYNVQMTPIYVNSFDMNIRIVGGSETTSCTIYFTAIEKTVHFDIEPYQVYLHVLEADEKFAVYNASTSTVKTNFSIRITVSNPVSVFAFIKFGQFSDVTNVLPVNALGTEYYGISHRYYETNDDAYAVIATQEGTVLFHNGMYAETLNEGQVYYRSSHNITGDYVTSNKPVAFFAQGKYISIPKSGYVSSLFQQLAHVRTWGKTFFVPVSLVGTDYVRIIAATDNTSITQIGGTILTDIPGAQTTLTNPLDAGQFVELEISLSNNGCFIFADKPVGVCSFLRSTQSMTGMEVPSQVWIPAIGQSISKVLMAPYVHQDFNFHYALVCTPTDSKGSTLVSIGGATLIPLSGGNWHDHEEAEMSFYNFPLTNLAASYIFSNPEKIIILGYGLGGRRSYYYLAGSAMRDLDAAFYANDIHYKDLKENPFCKDEIIEFRAEIEGLHTDPGSLMWYIDGAFQPALTDETTWNQSFSSGEHEIRMWVRYENEDTTSKIGTIIILPCSYSAEFYVNNVHHGSLQDITFCDKNVHFRAEIEGLSQEKGSIKWFIGEIEEEEQQDNMQWSKQFETETYEIKMWVRYDDGTEETIYGTLKMEVFWIKIRNVRH